MNAQEKPSLVSDQDAAEKPKPPREGEKADGSEIPVQPPIQRPDDEADERQPPGRREEDPPDPTHNDNVKPIDRPDSDDETA